MTRALRFTSLRFSSLLVITAAATTLAGCGGGGSSTPQVTVAISAAATTVEAGGEIKITAQVANSSQGVSWQMSPGSGTGAGVLMDATGTTVTYKAPGTPPANNVMVTVTAVAVAESTKSASVRITLNAISVATSANPSSVSAGGAAAVTAAVSGDPSNQGVTWTISPASGAGTLSNPTSTSVTYNAPATPPASDVEVTITATAVADHSKSSGVVITFAAIQIAVTVASDSVQAGGTVAVTATVSYDPSHQGVTWSISPATGAGTLTNASSTAVTYNAPPTPPANDLGVSITATSVSDTGISGNATITVLAITIGVTPTSAFIPLTAAQQYTATINNDPTNKGVSWVLTQTGITCSPACGTVMPTLPSGTLATYTAPTTAPASPGVTLTATSVEDGSKSATTAITISTGTVKLVPYTLNFGFLKVNRGVRTLIVTLTNTGTSAMAFTSSSITITGTGASQYKQTNTCAPSVGAAGSCTISVTFAPRVTGQANATLSITDSSTDSPQQVALTGTGTTSRFFGAEAVRSALVRSASAATPSTTGPNKVGTRVMELVDKSRNDPYLATGTKRELLVRFWYPAMGAQGCKVAEYTSAGVWSYLSQLKGVALPRVTTNSCWNAPMAGGPHPVVVFTHGYTGTFTDYSFLFEDLASRGYVVASVDHTYEATAVEFPDGRLAKSVVGSYLAQGARSDEKTLTRAVLIRLDDLKFVVNELERLNATVRGPFAGQLDMTRVALAGHSLGGLTALLGVEAEPRFRAGVVLDGMLPEGIPFGTQTPMLILNAGNEGWGENDCRLWNSLRGSRLSVNLKGAEHVTPTDAVWLARHAIKTGSMGPEKTVAAVRDYVAAFLDAHLRGLPETRLLKGPSREYTDAMVTAQDQAACRQP